jgi:hypothetical protein
MSTKIIAKKNLQIDEFTILNTTKVFNIQAMWLVDHLKASWRGLVIDWLGSRISAREADPHVAYLELSPTYFGRTFYL